MNDEIKVHVVSFNDRATYQLRWTCPHTGKAKTRSSGIKNDGKSKSRSDAARKAAELEAALKNNYTASTRAITWEQFRERYEREKGLSLSPRTRETIATAFNLVEEILSPTKLSLLTEERISHFAAAMREKGHTEATVKGRLAYLKAALRWAEKMKLIHRAPAIEIPGRKADRSKGRPITGEEFDRMISAVDKVIENEAERPAWRRYLRGLWFSGLRAGEAVGLSWDDEAKIRVDLSGRRPMLQIPADQEKGRKDRILPITPDFAELLEATPEAERVGRVFRLWAKDGRTWLEEDKVSKTVSAIGEKAGVIVKPALKGERPGDPDRKPAKFASSHDLRRSFGERWAQRVLPQVLQELMRHENIETTLRYYVGQNAERTADAIWAAAEKVTSEVTPAKGKRGKLKNPR